MSNTEQSLKHWRECVELAEAGFHTKAYQRRAITWAETARGFLPRDFPMAQHITVKVTDPLLLSCVCGESVVARNGQEIGRFLDRHNQCKAARQYRACPACGRLELIEHDHCRYCEAKMTGDEVVSRTADPVTQFAQYEILLEEGCYDTAAIVHVNSLREAMRAARAMFPGMKWLVNLVDYDGDEWGPDHLCR